jgi:hypothetical protein
MPIFCRECDGTGQKSDAKASLGRIGYGYNCAKRMSHFIGENGTHQLESFSHLGLETMMSRNSWITKEAVKFGLSALAVIAAIVSASIFQNQFTTMQDQLAVMKTDQRPWVGFG